MYLRFQLTNLEKKINNNIFLLNLERDDITLIEQY